MRFAIVVTGPAYGTQQASSAFQFAQALIAEGHELSCVFFYREGVYNANQLTSPASDEFDLVRGWQQLNAQHGVDPAAEMRKNGIALIMLLVLMAAELVLSYLVLTGSMRILTTDEMNYANIVKTTLLKAYGIATVVDIVLYLVPAFVGRPRR